jgi:uncharacterized protein
MIFDKLKKKALQSAKENSLELVDFGIYNLFTYARISNGKKIFIGVTLTPKDEGEITLLTYSSINEILKTKSYDLAFRAVALATINAIGQYELSKSKVKLKSNLREELSNLILKNSTELDRIVFVGNLSPVVKKLRSNQRDVTVFCRMDTNPKEKVYNDIFEYEAVSKASIVVITGASLIGSTIDALLKFTQKAKMVILAGFSAGTYPRWFEQIDFTHIASTYLEGCSVETIKQNNLEDIFQNPCYICSLKH